MHATIVHMKEGKNLYDRHMNKRALEKKERAKMKYHNKPDRNVDISKFVPRNDLETLELGMIVEIRGKIFTVMLGEDFYECRIKSSKDKDLERYLVIGERVYGTFSGGKGVIEGMEPRKSYLSRFRGDYQRISLANYDEHVIAANIDVGIIVAAAKDPEFHPRLIDRYLIMCENGNVEPIICLNKADLTDERDPVLDWYKKSGLRVIETSIQTGEGISELKDAIYGKIAVLVGHSGVGKSSLVNMILPGVNIVTKEVGDKRKTGRHTTTTSKLFEWEGGSYIIDTPGIRSLGLQHIDRDRLKYAFTEFSEYTEDCKYNDCSHSHEPVCGVKKAVQEGKIPHHRYDSYIRMLNE